MTAPAADRAVDVALRDGSTVRIRPIREDDVQGLAELLRRLSIESHWLRFFSAGVDLDAMARWAVTRGGGRGYGLVATAGTPERIVGHAGYVRTIADRVATWRRGRGNQPLLQPAE